MWTYVQKSGFIIDPSGKLLGAGYAGFGVGKNNPLMQDVHDVGPLPVGRYRMVEVYDSPRTGSFTIRLEPEPETQMYHRGDMRIHGDSKEHPGAASHGCVVALPAYRHTMWGSDDHLVDVVADLPHDRYVALGVVPKESA